MTDIRDEDFMMARDEFAKRHSAFIIVNNQKIIGESTEKGVAPFFHAVDSLEGLKGASLADRVVGKAVALLSLFAGIDSIYTPLISTPAIHVLSRHSTHVDADTIVPMILNRTQTDRCPIEAMVLACDNPTDAYRILKEKFTGGKGNAV
ncbi:MAG: DUF1893 domain-containing protein [Theionarchaea archaeon]|nr:DUF1893 domain-containing protein [Theionarchaea archaeon]